MAKYRGTVQTFSTFEVEAENDAEALKKLDEAYKNATITKEKYTVNEPKNLDKAKAKAKESKEKK